MKQLENNIDTYFKSRIDPIILELDKDKAWEKLKRKRLNTQMRYYAMAVAAAVLVGLILIFPKKNPRENESIMSEFKKRQKLMEYESKIAGTYEEILLCYDCSGDIMMSVIKQVPENELQLEIY